VQRVERTREREERNDEKNSSVVRSSGWESRLKSSHRAIRVSSDSERSSGGREEERRRKKKKEEERR
jgi:hypothetical protein